MYEIFHSSFQQMLGECCNARFPWANREFKKLRWQLKRKRHIKIELCVRVNALRLFQVGHVVQNKRSALSLSWHEWFSWKGKAESNAAVKRRACANGYSFGSHGLISHAKIKFKGKHGKQPVSRKIYAKKLKRS